MIQLPRRRLSRLTPFVFVSLVSSPLLAGETRIVNSIVPPHATDMDSAEGYFCSTPYGAVADIKSYCSTNGSAHIPRTGMEFADRLTVDYAGRLWMIRRGDNVDADPGLYIEINEAAVLVAPLPELSGSDEVDILVMGGSPEMSRFGDCDNIDCEIPSRVPFVFTEARRLFFYVYWTETSGGQPITKGWREILPSPAGNWLALSHVTIANMSFPMLLSSSAVPVAIGPAALRESAVLDNMVAMFPFPEDVLPLLSPEGLELTQGRYRRFAWSAQYWANAPLQDSWKLPDNAEPNFDIYLGSFIYGLTSDLGYYSKMFEYERYNRYEPIANYTEAIDSKVTEPPLIFPAFNAHDGVDSVQHYKLVALEGLSNWGGFDDVKLVYLSQNGRLNGIKVTPYTTLEQEFEPQRLKIWPESLVLPDSDFEVENTPAGPMYIKKSAGYAQVPSVAVPTYKLPLPRDQFAIDVTIPSQQPGQSGWTGDIQMAIQIGSAGISEYIGYQSLSGLPKGETTTVSFPVSSSVRDALLGDHPGVEILTFVNTGVANVAISNLSFAGAPSQTIRAPHVSTDSGVRTNPTLDFEAGPDWTSTFIEYTNDSSSGLRAIRLSASGWVEIVSPEIGTNDLPDIGSRLTYNIRVPSPAPNPYWEGDTQLWISCPDIDLYDEWVGWQPLNNLFVNEYNTVSFDLPIDILDALDTPNISCQFRIAVNTAASEQPISFYVDKVGFAD